MKKKSIKIDRSRIFRCVKPATELVFFQKKHWKTCVFRTKGPTSQKLLFRLLRSCVLLLSPPPLLLFSRPPPNFILVHPSKICKAKHKVVAFPKSRATVRAIRSDRPDPAEICRFWVWTTWPFGTNSCPTFGKRYYIGMFRWKLLRRPFGRLSTRQKKKRKIFPNGKVQNAHFELLTILDRECFSNLFQCWWTNISELKRKRRIQLFQKSKAFAMVSNAVDTIWILLVALSVKVLEFIQARTNGESNYDSLKVAKK